jgi:hypothetical protein
MFMMRPRPDQEGYLPGGRYSIAAEDAVVDEAEIK